MTKLVNLVFESSFHRNNIIYLQTFDFDGSFFIGFQFQKSLGRPFFTMCHNTKSVEITGKYTALEMCSNCLK